MLSSPFGVTTVIRTKEEVGNALIRFLNKSATCPEWYWSRPFPRTKKREIPRRSRHSSLSNAFRSRGRCK
eukprot:1971290-Karenia_brevis.AAC.1